MGHHGDDHDEGGDRSKRMLLVGLLVCLVGAGVVIFLVVRSHTTADAAVAPSPVAAPSALAIAQPAAPGSTPGSTRSITEV